MNGPVDTDVSTVQLPAVALRAGHLVLLRDGLGVVRMVRLEEAVRVGSRHVVLTSSDGLFLRRPVHELFTVVTT